MLHVVQQMNYCNVWSKGLRLLYKKVNRKVQGMPQSQSLEYVEDWISGCSNSLPLAYMVMVSG